MLPGNQGLRADMLIRAFPETCSKDVLLVGNNIPKEAYVTEDMPFCRYQLPGGEEIAFPYRIYGAGAAEPSAGFTPTQKLIFHALLSRSDNGFAREKHLREMLVRDTPVWLFPYLVKLSDEYVIALLEIIYAHFKEQDCGSIKQFCKQNAASFVRSYDRMVSYWSEYYSGQPFQHYVGEKLFRECYGYQRSMWRKSAP